MRTFTLFALCAALAVFAYAQRGQGNQQQSKPVFDPADGVVGARYPSLSPDGEKVVFTLHGDLWSMPSEGGRATRLTLHGAYDSRPLVTPDGKEIVFVSDREGSYDLYVMPIDGGTPRRLTHHFAGEVPTGFTADGENVLFSSRRTMGWNRGGADEVWQVPIAGGTPERLTFTGGNSATTPDNGNVLYYVSGASDHKVREYEGSANDRLYRKVGDNPPEELLAYRGNSREPYISKDGETLYFIREVDGNFELFRCDATADTCEQVTNLGDGGLTQVAYSTDETRIVFKWKFYLYSLDLRNAGEDPKLLKIDIREDSPEDEEIERRFTSGVSRAHLGRDGKRIVFGLAGDIWLMDANGGTARAVTNDAYQNENPQLSPDGRTISFYSNRSGNSDIWVIRTDGQGLRQITTNPADEFFQTWSPDGTKLAFCSTRSGNKDIWVKGIDGSPAVQLTTHSEGDDDPVFSPDGKYIAFDSGRTGNTDIWIMESDGSNKRRVYGTPAIEEVPVFSPDGRFIAFDRITRGATFMRQELVVTDLQGSGEVLIGEGAYASYTPDGKEILFVNEDGRLNYANAPAGIETGRSVPFTAVRRVSKKEEMLKAFDEAHQSFAQTFYDPEFHGKDWEALGRKYRALVENANTREEFLYYLNRMVGEVSASHTGANANTIDEEDRFQTGYLGMDLKPERFQRNRLRMKVLKVEKDGPADEAWIREGDYIFRINRRPIGARDNFYAHLEDSIGKDVSLFVADNPRGEDFREVVVKPESWAQRRMRLYREYVTDNKQTTAQATRGRVAYVHIASMNQSSLMQFQNELASPQVQRAGSLIIDVRDNGGGNIHQQLIDLLSRKPYAYIQTRDGRRIGQPQVHWNRPIVILINERSYSDAEVFPHAMKTLGMATIVGVQTPGAVIGTRGMQLSDGTSWRLPSSGFYNIDGTNQEHNGCKPDITVEITPEDQLNGRDPQLEKAIEVCMKEMREERAPVEEPEPEDDEPAKTGEFVEPPALPWDDS